MNIGFVATIKCAYTVGDNLPTVTLVIQAVIV
jgi:hypothetical protein